MALTDVLPDRPLTFDEFQDLQAQDTFESVTTERGQTREIDVVFVSLDGDEHMLHYADDRGWHLHSDDNGD